MTTSNVSFQEAGKLYWKLNSLYGSPYSDKQEEMDKAWHILHQHLNKGVEPEVFTRKLKQLIEMEGGFKTKFSSIITNRYWQKQFVQPIPMYRYIIEQ